MSDANLYQLYDFENQFDQFLAGLTSGERQTFQKCKESSGLLKQCTMVGLFSPQVEGRCDANKWGLSREILPILGLVDAMGEYQKALAGEMAEVLTAQEASAKNTAATMQFLFGIPLPPLTLAAMGKIGGKIASRKAISEAHQGGAKLTASSNVLSKADQMVAQRRLSGRPFHAGTTEVGSIYTGGKRTVNRVSIGKSLDDFDGRLDYLVSEKNGSKVLNIEMVYVARSRMDGEKRVGDWLLAEALVNEKNSINVVCGSWKKSNERIFKENIRKGMDKVQAAINTPTGQSMVRLGFVNFDESLSTVLQQSATLCMRR